MEYIVSRWMNIKLCVFLTVNNKEFVQKTNSSRYASTLTVQLFLRKSHGSRQENAIEGQAALAGFLVIKFHSCV